MLEELALNDQQRLDENHKAYSQELSRGRTSFWVYREASSEILFNDWRQAVHIFDLWRSVRSDEIQRS